MQFWQLRIDSPYILGVSILLLLSTLIYKTMYRQQIKYVYPLAGILARYGGNMAAVRRFVFKITRFAIFTSLILAASRLQKVDVRTKVPVEGVDIVLALDVSGSMQSGDGNASGDTRFEVAKREALRFIDKRLNDPIGLVLFGLVAVARCPLTLDRDVVSDIIRDTELGEIDPSGTALCGAIASACARLRSSKAKSKVIVLLTDGEPQEDYVAPGDAIRMAKELGIRIYTIGVGSSTGSIVHPVFGVIRGGFALNRELLQKISDETGGKFFEARGEDEIRRVYEIIDQLEKVEYETEIYSTYYDLYFPLLLIALLFLAFEALLSGSIWFGMTND